MATKLTSKAFKYWSVALFFLAWNQKRKLRDILHYTSLAVISLSTVLLLIEVIAEYRGAETIVTALRGFETVYGHFVFAIFVAGVLFMLWHHYEETQKPQFEYAFVLRLWEFMEGRRQGAPQPVRNVLEIFHGLFKKSGIAHVSIYRMQSGILKIDPQEVYPSVPANDQDFYVDLPKGEGVAGHVYNDMKARYMPVLFLGPLFFPHAIDFEWQTTPLPGSTRPTFDLRDLDFELDVFKPSPSRQFRFRSFLSVPLRSSKSNGCVGVLNFDFDRLDPLEKRDIAMGMVIGLILGEEI